MLKFFGLSSKAPKRKETSMSWLQSVQKVAAEHQFQIIDAETGEIVTGKRRDAALESDAALETLESNVVLLDAFTARMILAVYNAINAGNKAKMESMSFMKAHSVVMKLAAKGLIK